MIRIATRRYPSRLTMETALSYSIRNDVWTSVRRDADFTVVLGIMMVLSLCRWEATLNEIIGLSGLFSKKIWLVLGAGAVRKGFLWDFYRTRYPFD